MAAHGARGMLTTPKPHPRGRPPAQVTTQGEKAHATEVQVPISFTRRLLLTGLLSTASADRIKIEDGVSYSRGAGFESKRMTRGLDAVGIEPTSVHAVLLTHSHGDHIGAIDIYESAALVGMAADAPLLEEQGEGELDLDVALEATPCSPTAARTSS